MPKMLITEACLVNFGDDRGGVDAAIGDMPDVPRDQATILARAGRALFVNEKDDVDPSGRYTASPALVKAAQEAAKARTKAA